MFESINEVDLVIKKGKVKFSKQSNWNESSYTTIKLLKLCLLANEHIFTLLFPNFKKVMTMNC